MMSNHMTGGSRSSALTPYAKKWHFHMQLPNVATYAIYSCPLFCIMLSTILQ